MRSVMLDLETWGTRPGSALRLIGAIAFEADGKIGDEFYRNISEDTCLAAGLTVDPDTEEWWLRQSEEARAAVLVDPQPLSRVVIDFHQWFALAQGAQYVWSHGANFDEPLWTAAAHACNERVPWKYWNSRCTRTLFHLARLDTRNVPRQGTHHNALDDCRFQIECVHLAYNMLRAEAMA